MNPSIKSTSAYSANLCVQQYSPLLRVSGRDHLRSVLVVDVRKGV